MQSTCCAQERALGDVRPVAALPQVLRDAALLSLVLLQYDDPCCVLDPAACVRNVESG